MAQLWKKLKPLIVSLILIGILFGTAVLFSPKENRGARSLYEKNLTKEIAPDAVHPKDLITINYELSIPAEDDRVIDTNNATIAKKTRLKTFSEGPYRFIVGKSNKVKGFDNAIVGMKAGETKEFIIPPSESATRYLINKTREFSRNQPLPKMQVIPVRSFKKLFGKDPKLNDIVFTTKFPWKYQVINVSNEAVGVDALVNAGEEIALPGMPWKSKILIVEPHEFIIRHNPKEGQTMQTSLGPAVINATTGTIKIMYHVTPGQLVEYSRNVGGINTPHLFKVMNVTDQKILLEREDNPAEKTLKLKVTVLDRSAVLYKPN